MPTSPTFKIGTLISRGPSKGQKDIGLIVGYGKGKSPEGREYLLYKIKLLADAYRRSRVDSRIPRAQYIYIDHPTIQVFWDIHNENI